MKKLMNGILVLIVGLFIALVYSGLFSTIEIQEREIGPFTMVYRHYVGDYTQAAAIQHEILSALKGLYKIPSGKGFGVYYDDPQHVEKHKLRSDVGCIIETKDPQLLEKIRERYLVKEYPSTLSVVSEFPYKNQLSVFLGVVRVYPRLEGYLKSKNYKISPALEIYDLSNRKIVFSFQKVAD